MVESPLLARLTWLNLSLNRSLGGRAVRMLAQAPAAAALEDLALSFTNIGAGGLRDVLTSPFLTGLTGLWVAMIGLYRAAGVRAADLAATPILPRLMELDLGGFPESGGLPELLRSPALARLTSLRLADSGLRDEGAASITRSPHLRGLKTLDLALNGMGPEGLEMLAASENLSGLTALHLGHNAVRDAGAKALAASSTLTRLTVLDLSNNAVGGPGIRALAASPNVARLTTLDLSGNYVNFDGVRALTASSQLRRLRELRVRNAGLPDAEDLTAILADAPGVPFVLHENGWLRRRRTARRAMNAAVRPVTMAG